MKENIVLFIIIILSEINYFICQNCTREYPFTKENKCVSSCTIDEINEKRCEVENIIIKTQWLNNIISKGDKDFIYANVVTSENNYLYYITSRYPRSNLRTIYILDHEGYGYFNRTNPFINVVIDDPNEKGRYDSEIFTIKLLSENDNKEYLISIGKGNQDTELYDFYEEKIYCNNISETFGILDNVDRVVGHIKLYSKENKNIYLIGLLSHEYNNEGIEEYYYYLKKLTFSSLDIKNNPPTYETQKNKCSNSKIISCYQTINNFIICFFNNIYYEYIMIVYSDDLIEKTKIVIANGSLNDNYEKIFFKCIHFFEEVGAFGYFTNDDNPIIAFQFKQYSDVNNSINDYYRTFSQIKIENYFFNREYVTSCDMIKANDKKFYFTGFSINKDIIYIISLFNYNEENFINRVYSVKIKDFYNFSIIQSIAISLYKNFLVLVSTNYGITESISYSSLIIFSYPNTTEVNLDLYNYIMYNKDIKIYNLTLKLKGEYLLENNIFGYIYCGVQIIENCNELDDIFLANLDNEKISNNYFLPQNEKVKLFIPKNDQYYPFICKVKYAVVVTEPDNLEYNKYPIEIIDTGKTEKEESFFENNKKKYIGRYSFYYLSLRYRLTEINCTDTNCELCYLHNKVMCVSHYNINNNIKENYTQDNATNSID